MLTALVAVLGTLAGSVLTGTLAHLSQQAQRKAAAATARQTEGLTALTELAATLADHRRAMWVREDTRLRGEDWSAARTESHATGSAITAPLLRVSILLPALAPAARAAAEATYALRGAADQTTLTAAREHAIAQTDRLVAAAGAALSA
ncbi:protein kilB [Streptomyces sp. NPDC015350]|uniref:protein kilB n=1 Tax=Streptomyces sp. NPDC015350 TaxID=3364955 RepID=UPI0036FDD37A